MYYHVILLSKNHKILGPNKYKSVVVMAIARPKNSLPQGRKVWTIS